MPADLVPHADIPALAGRVTPEMLQVLRRVQKADFILNSADVKPDLAEILRGLAELGLVDPGYDMNASGPPQMWVANGNGARVLTYKTGIRGGPHYELPAAELAAWLEQQGPGRWWSVDGDSLLTGRLTFPCPARKLAAELRQIGRPLLVQAKKDDGAARGQAISKEKIDAVADRFADAASTMGGGTPDSDDRILYLCWKGATEEWLLAEDSETAALMATASPGDRSPAETN